jgi:hypothetical protein
MKGEHVVAEDVPLPTVRRRTGWRSPADQIDLTDDWDSPGLNAQIADDFGVPS